MADIIEERRAEAEITGDVIRSDEDEKQIKNYITEEIYKVEEGGERKELLNKVKKWRRQREARPETEYKDFPWEKASNITVPLAMTNGNAIFALLKASLGSRNPFWMVETDDEEFLDKAEALEKFLDALAESRYHLNLRKANNDILYNVGTLGTQFVKIPWTTEIWNFKRRSAGGGIEQVSKVVRDSPTIIPIRYEDFITRPYWNDIQRAPWVAHRVTLFEHELMQRAESGIYENVEEVLKAGKGELSDERLDELRRMGIEPDLAESGLFTIYETYLYYDVDGDGIPEDIIIWFDPLTQTILRSEFNDLGVRPIVRLSYLPRPNELYSIGTGWMLEHLQDEIDTLHNMRIDGTMLSMLQMYVSRRGSGIGPGERFRPLKNIQVDNPKEDFLPIKFPDIGPGTIQAELLAREYGNRGVGVTDYMTGFESQTVKSRSTLGGTLFLAEQGNKIFDSVLEGIEDDYSIVGQIILFQCVRNREKIFEQLDLVPEEYHERLKEIFSMSVEELPRVMRVRVRTTEIEKSEEAKRQNLLTLSQLYNMYGENVFKLLPMIYSKELNVPEEIKVAAAKFFTGSTSLMGDIFKFFGQANVRKYLPYVKDIEMMLKAIENMKNQQVVGGGARGIPAGGGEMGATAGGGGAAGPAGGEPGMGAPEGNVGYGEGAE